MQQRVQGGLGALAFPRQGEVVDLGVRRREVDGGDRAAGGEPAEDLRARAGSPARRPAGSYGSMRDGDCGIAARKAISAHDRSSTGLSR